MGSRGEHGGNHSRHVTPRCTMNAATSQPDAATSPRRRNQCCREVGLGEEEVGPFTAQMSLMRAMCEESW